MPGKVNDPQIVTAPDTITITWSPSGGKQTGYKVACSPLLAEMEDSSVDTSSGFIKTMDSSCREVMAEGLEPDSEYKIEIWSLSGDKEGESITLTAKTMSTDSELNCCPITTAVKLTSTWSC